MTTSPVVPPLLRIGRTPPICVSASDSVRDATRAMVENKVGAVAVVEDDRLAGIFTERDLMVKVSYRDLDLDQTTVGEVMVSTPVTIAPDAKRSTALELMLQNHCRHLPLTSAEGEVLGMLSIRHLLRHQLDRLMDQMDSLESYLAADGPGG